MAQRTLTLEMAVQAFQQGNLGEAARISRKILKRQSNNPNALHIAGIIAYQMGKLKDARKFILKAVRIAPNFHEAHSNLGLVLSAMGDNQGAAKSFTTALGMAPDNPDTHNNLGLALEEQGLLDDAATSYQKALAIAPRYPEAFFNSGNVLHKLGDTEAAIQRFQTAVDLDPELVQAWTNMANVERKAGNHEAAQKHYEKALEFRPDDFASLFGLGELNESARNYEEAVSYYRRCVELQPDYALAHSNLGFALNALGASEEAEASYQKAIDIDPEQPSPWHNRALILREKGDFEGAIADLKRALEIDPEYAEPYYELGSNFSNACDDALIARMIQLFETTDMEDAKKALIGFGLNGAIKKKGDAKRAFTFLSAANRLRYETANHSQEKDRQRFDALKTAVVNCRDELTLSIQDTGWRPLFIVGMPRSGTTLVEQILACHAEIEAAGELEFVHDALKQVAINVGREFPDDFEAFERSDIEFVSNFYRERHAGRGASVRFITDKLPHNFVNLAIIRHAFPGSPVIHVQRDPIDNCFSMFEANFARGHDYCYDMEALGRYHLLYADFMSHCSEAAPGLVYGLSYEKLIADTESEVRKLLEHCGLPFDEACLSPHKSTRAVKTASSVQVRNPIYKTSVKRWQAVEEEFAPLIDILNGNA